MDPQLQKDQSVTEAALTATAYSSVPSNGGKQVMLTKQTALKIGLGSCCACILTVPFTVTFLFCQVERIFSIQA